MGVHRISGMSAPKSAAAASLVTRLKLQPHPEGGWYRETFRSDLAIAQAALPPRYGGDRRALTSILYLLETGDRSHRHRLQSDEIWLHQLGDGVRLRTTSGDGAERFDVDVGPDPEARLQHHVPAGWWQEADVLPGPHGFALVACVMAPGFEFDDFELAGDA